MIQIIGVIVVKLIVLLIFAFALAEVYAVQREPKPTSEQTKWALALTGVAIVCALFLVAK